MKFGVVNELHEEYPVRDLCGYLRCSRSGYYKWVRRQRIRTAKDLDDELLSRLVREIHQRRRIYGYRRVTITLGKQTDRVINRKRVQRLMQRMGLRSVIRKRRYHRFEVYSNLVVCPNLLDRNFSAAEPGIKYVTDITCFIVGQGRYYLSTILDLYNGQVVAHHHQPTMDMFLVTKTLEKWFEKSDGLEGSILHSDQGGHYTARVFHDMLAAKGIIQSMSRKACPLDNAAMESFFGHLKCEAIYCRSFRNTGELGQAIEDYIRFYNHERPHSRLNGKAPVEYLNERLSA